jgi:6-phosphogluconolactonase
MATDIQRFETPEDVAREAARRIVDAADAAIAERGRFILALSGGETPRLTYGCLAHADMRDEMRWADTILLWSDERCVPPDDDGSNYRMAREALLDHVSIPADNILRIRGEGCPIAEDERYERALHRLLDAPPTAGRIDLMLLGVGADGHTASLFPNSPALVERRRWVLPATGPAPYPRRITLTLPIVNASRNVIVLATGAQKAHIVRALLDGSVEAMRWPIALVQPHDGRALWLVDRAAHPR